MKTTARFTVISRTEEAVSRFSGLLFGFGFHDLTRPTRTAAGSCFCVITGSTAAPWCDCNKKLRWQAAFSRWLWPGPPVTPLVLYLCLSHGGVRQCAVIGSLFLGHTPCRLWLKGLCCFIDSPEGQVTIRECRRCGVRDFILVIRTHQCGGGGNVVFGEARVGVSENRFRFQNPTFLSQSVQNYI